MAIKRGRWALSQVQSQRGLAANEAIPCRCSLRCWRFLRLYFLRRLWLIGIEKTKGVWWLDHVNACLDLFLANLLVQLFHLGPMDLRLVMMFGVIAVVKPELAIQFPVTAHTPSNRLIRIPTVVAVIPLKI